MAANDLADAIRNLAAQKDEHRDLVRQIAADPGMSPQLRETLLAHIYEEETEKVLELQTLAGGGAAPRAAAGASPGATASSTGLTVGSLRLELAYPDGATVGSLRGL